MNIIHDFMSFLRQRIPLKLEEEAQMIRLLHKLSYPSGVLINSDEMKDRIYFVAKGILREFYILETGEEITIT
jgi:CRP-like cAMP-binding protein